MTKLIVYGLIGAGALAIVVRMVFWLVDFLRYTPEVETLAPRASGLRRSHRRVS